jgi:predicted nucleic acid-binding Zn finger protein
MLQSKDIKKVSELKNGFTHRWLEPDFILSSLKCFSFSKTCKVLNPLKLRGYSFESIFSILICLPFLGMKNINNVMNSPFSGYVKAKKDTFYRLKNSHKIYWRMVLWLFAMKFIKLTTTQGTADEGFPKCLIFDDSTLEKTGKSIEKISRVWDHVSQRFILGYKLLTMGYWDGISFIPFDFSLHREKGKNKDKPYGLKKKEYRKMYHKKREKGTHSWDRAKEAEESKIKCAIKMFWRAVSQGVKIDYVLMDSWFTCQQFIDAVRKVKKQNIHLIGMYKTPKTKFGYSGKELTHKQIRNILGKPKRCRSLRLYYKEAVVSYKGKPMKLYFSKQGKNGKWKVFISTDTELSFIRMIEIYQTRWSIEVFFKETKQLLGLGKCQSNDFDGQIADTTTTFIQYILLTLKHRFDRYESKGALFREIESNITEYRLNERLWGLFVELVKIIEVLFEGVDEAEIMSKILNDEEAYKILNRLLSPDISMNNAA